MHHGLNTAIDTVLNATRQRCRFHLMRSAVTHTGKTPRRDLRASTMSRKKLSNVHRIEIARYLNMCIDQSKHLDKVGDVDCHVRKNWYG